MSKGYIWISTDILACLLELPEDVHISGILSSDFRQGQIGIIITGNGLPINGEAMNELVPIYKSTRGGDFSFVEWRAPG